MERTHFKIHDRVMTPQGTKVVVTWIVLGFKEDEEWVVVGENATEALRAATLLEEDRILGQGYDFVEE